jgi:hypothetical protein
LTKFTSPLDLDITYHWLELLFEQKPYKNIWFSGHTYVIDMDSNVWSKDLIKNLFRLEKITPLELINFASGKNYTEISNDDVEYALQAICAYIKSDCSSEKFLLFVRKYYNYRFKDSDFSQMLINFITSDAHSHLVSNMKKQSSLDFSHLKQISYLYSCFNVCNSEDVIYITESGSSDDIYLSN